MSLSSIQCVCPMCGEITVMMNPPLRVNINTLFCTDCFDEQFSAYDDDSEESTVELVEGDTQLNPIDID